MTSGTAWQFRRAVPDDAAVLRGLHERAIRKLGLAGYSRAECDSWAQGLEDERYAAAMVEGEAFELALTPEGRPVGFCSWRKREILGLFVEPAFARRGVASALVDRAEAAIAGQGFPKIVVGAALSGVPFYEQRGYRVDERHLWTSRGGLPLEVAWMSKDILRAVGSGPRPASPLQRLREAGPDGFAAAIAELKRDRFASLALEDAAWVDPRGRAVALLGPPGAGKAELAQALQASLGARELKLCHLEIGGAPGQVGDPAGAVVERLSVAEAARLLHPAIVLARAVFDLVILRASVPSALDRWLFKSCDLDLFLMRPASTDMLALMTAGLLPTPDQLLIVQEPDNAAAEARMAGRLAQLAPGKLGGMLVELKKPGQDLIARLCERQSGDAERRHLQARAWIAAAVQEEYGRRGSAQMEARLGRLADDRRHSPSRRLSAILSALADGSGGPDRG